MSNIDQIVAETRAQQAEADRERQAKVAEDIKNGFRELKLKNGTTALVDPEDYDRVFAYPMRFSMNLSWCAIKENKRTVAAIVSSKNGFRRTIRLQHVVLDIVDSSIHIRFLNGNSLDCRKANLKIGRNIRSELSPNVRFREDLNKWVAQIKVEPGVVGFFASEAEALAAYNEARSAVIKVIAEHKKKFSFVRE